MKPKWTSWVWGLFSDILDKLIGRTDRSGGFAARGSHRDGPEHQTGRNQFLDNDRGQVGDGRVHLQVSEIEGRVQRICEAGENQRPQENAENYRLFGI